MALAAALATSEAREVNVLKIGADAPDFSLPGVDGKTHTLREFDDSKVLVIIFTCNHCPTAQAYEDRIIQMQQNYEDDGVKIVAISPNDPSAVTLSELGYTDLSDSFEEMKIRAKNKQFNFPYLYDGETQATSEAYGVLATPHAYIFDAERKLRYVGRIDDSEVKQVKVHDARNAIDALLANKAVEVPKTRVFGCSTKWTDKKGKAAELITKWNAEAVELNLIDPEGLKELVKNDTNKYRLINVWATWCGPCIAELPEFVTMHRMYRQRKFELITVSADEPDARSAALKVLQKNHVSAKNYLFNSDDRNALFDSIDKKWEGAVPYTVLVAPGGKIVYRNHAEIDPLKIKSIIADHIGRTYASR
jgi:peroxiredoxin